ncbi:hypothetical protein Nepgr_031565 [Nepenthes gracilis]|uniref:Pectinesterase inhibitor domain-containing protein n=1 Tax=Nepenthes gracilis TaxID=150966 RepID=A0AAD3THT8_NEPGR|nr:hypothetical protein Nepgr_031565 [Nepenthes gracilis]
MKSLFLLFIILSIFLAARIEADKRLIHRTCKKAEAYYTLCVKTIEADPRSKTADAAGLAVVVVDKVKSQVTETIGIVKELMAITSDPVERQFLSGCVWRYNAVLNAILLGSIEAMKKGDYAFARDALKEAAFEVQTCEKSFAIVGSGQSPIAALNQVLNDLSVMTATIIDAII